MPRISTTGANQALVTTNWNFISLHTADPGTTGASEVPTNANYSRGAVTWGTPASSAVSNSGAVSVNIPANTTATHFGVWSASTGGTYYIGGALSSNVVSGTSPGTVTFAISGLTVTAS